MLATATGSTDAVADFGDDRRDVYKLFVHAGDTLRVSTSPLPLGGNLGLDVAIFVLGIGYAYYVKSNDRAKYETIGRMINEGL